MEFQSVFSKEQRAKWDRTEQLQEQINEMLDKSLRPNDELLVEYKGLVGEHLYLVMKERVRCRLEEFAVMRLVKEANDSTSAIVTNRLLAAILLKLHGKSLT